jgi:glycosyltransferase involved in cell wall biosynthesis
MTVASNQTTPIFSVITPSFNMLPYLRLCSRSISDQNVYHEHIVVDAASTDGTVEWLNQQADILSISEKDEGMYDAVNKGIRRSRGEIISYLNCDEQYLPGTLQRVGEYFRSNPDVDMLFGNTLIIRPDGQLLAYRKSFTPRWQYIWSSFLYLYTCSMFVRRRVFESGVLFIKDWKTVGDAVFVIDALRKGFRPRHVPEYFSAFMITGGNLSTGETANAELKAFHDSAPWWLRKFRFITHPLIRLEKFLHGGYRETFPFSYSVYAANRPDGRREITVDRASPLWKRWKIE